MDNVSVRTNCAECGRRLGFDEWSRGLERCPYCTSVPRPQQQPAARPEASRAAAGEAYEQYAAMLDDVPQELVDELVAMLEAEVERRPELAAKLAGQHAGSSAADMANLRFGRTVREYHWAAWGFVLGFGLNVALAKYAQMTANASMHEFLAPMLIGGFIAGLACGAIGWGAAKLREPAR